MELGNEKLQISIYFPKIYYIKINTEPTISVSRTPNWRISIQKILNHCVGSDDDDDGTS